MLMFNTLPLSKDCLTVKMRVHCLFKPSLTVYKSMSHKAGIFSNWYMRTLHIASYCCFCHLAYCCCIYCIQPWGVFAPSSLLHHKFLQVNSEIWLDVQKFAYH